MARILSDEPCKVTFDDNIAGGKITVFYRLPTPEERIKYSNSQISRHGRKVESIVGDTRQKFGLKILTGITDGEFAKEKNKLISSNPESPDYDPTWKSIIAKHASDVVANLAMHAFEGALTREEPEEEGEETAEDPS